MTKLNIYDKLRDILKTSKVKLIPVALTTTFILTGCADNNIETAINSVGNFLVRTETVKDDQDSSEIADAYKLEAEVIDEDYSMVGQFVGTEDYICNSTSELEEYVDVRYPTYDDIRSAIVENAGIYGRYEEWLLTGINNLEGNAPHLDLIALYQNLKKITINDQLSDDVKAWTRPLGVYLSEEDNTMLVNQDSVTPYILCREVIGKGITKCAIELDDKKLIYDTNLKVFSDKDNRDKTEIGQGIKEGVMDILANLATNTVGEGHYDMMAEQFRIYSEVVGYSLNDYVKSGTLGLLNKMKEKTIERPTKFIVAVDELIDESYNVDTQDSMEGSIIRFFVDYVGEDTKDADMITSAQEVASNVLENSSYEVVQTGMLVTDMDYLEESVIERLESMKSGKSR